MEQQIELRVNGKNYHLSVPAHWSLARTLREKLRLTGTKVSCEQGDCGACTVIIDKKAVQSCIIPVHDCVGKDILTIEGISEKDQLHFVQRAFMKAGAIQCGFCTPGMVMSIVALYMVNENPTEEDIKKAIAGNLCRCTGYKKIIDVAKEIEKERAGVSESPSESPVGVNFVRKDSFSKVTGRAKYVNDFFMDNMLYGAILRSQVAHGKIISLDVSKARQLPGVKAVLSAQDVGKRLFGQEVRDQPVFAFDKVRYVGEPLATVAAVDPETAEAALKLIEVNIEELPANFDAVDSMAKDAVIIHEDFDNYEKVNTIIPDGPDAPKNVCWHIRVHKGDVEAGFAKADLVVEDEVVSHKTHPGYIEPHGSLAYVDDNGYLNVISATQKPYFVRMMLSSILDMPQSKIIVKAPTIGGGFGGKLMIIPEPYSALLAIKTGQPVKIIISRQEELIAAATRHKYRVKIKSGVMKDGTVIARKIKVIADAGAYTLDSQGDLSLATFGAAGPYRYENLDMDVYAIYTNNVPAASNRAPFALPSTFGMETHMDLLARKLGMDPLTLRLKNILRSGDKAFNGQEIINCGLEECLNKVAKRLDWQSGRLQNDLGKGIACMWWCSGNFPGSAMVSVNDDGSVQIISGCNEIGTGSKVTGIPQIAAKALGVDFDMITLSDSDTSHAAYDHGVGASRMVYTIGKAVLLCCEQIKEKLTSFLVDEGLSKDKNVSFRQGYVVLHSQGDQKILLGEVAKKYKAKHGPVVGQASVYMPFPDHDADCMEGMLFPAYPAPTFVAQGAIAGIDTKTGLINVKKMVAAQDVGLALNPMAIEGQMEGGMIMGMGYALSEELVNERGKIMNTSFHDYKLMTAMDMPEIETDIVECYELEESGPMGAKAAAESAVGPAAAAIGNAIYAITGTRPKDTRLHMLR